MTNTLLTVTLAHSSDVLRVATFTAALAAIAAARAVQTVSLVNVFDAEHPGTVAVYVDSDEAAPVAVIQRNP